MTDQCPYIKEVEASDTNIPRIFHRTNGAEYVFYDHIDPDGKRIMVQFCQLVGRVRDPFRCLNRAEWSQCVHHQLAMRNG